MLDYPQHLYPGGDLTKASRLVKNAEEQAAAEADGYEAIARHYGPGVSGVLDEAAQAAALDYPRHLYLGGDVEAASVLVRNADEEAAASGDGYARYEPVAAASPAEDIENRVRARSPGRPGRPGRPSGR